MIRTNQSTSAFLSTSPPMKSLRAALNVMQYKDVKYATSKPSRVTEIAEIIGIHPYTTLSYNHAYSSVRMI